MDHLGWVACMLEGAVADLPILAHISGADAASITLLKDSAEGSFAPWAELAGVLAALHWGRPWASVCLSASLSATGSTLPVSVPV